MLASGGLEGRINLWDVGRLMRPIGSLLFTPDGEGLLAVAFAPDGLTAAAGGHKSRVVLRDLT